YRPSDAPRPHGRAAPCVASSDAVRAPRRRDARRHAVALAPAQCRHGDARGLEVSPGGLLQNELIQRQIGNRLAQPAVLQLKVLQALHLFGLHPAELLTPPIIRHLAHADLADCVHHVLALRDQNIDLPQLRNDLFRLVSLPCHCSPPGCQRHTSSRTTSMGVDQATYRTPRLPTWWCTASRPGCSARSHRARWTDRTSPSRGPSDR